MSERAEDIWPLVVNGEHYYSETALVAALVQAYHDGPTVVAAMCDGILDRSGRLLGVVRQRASSPEGQKP